MNREYNLFTHAGYIVFALVAFAACSTGGKKDGAPTKQVDFDSIPDAVPKLEPRSKRGNPESYRVRGKRYYVKESSRGYKAKGVASWYGTKFHGRETSSGEIYDMYKMTAAHKTLPIPTYVKVTNLENQRSVIVRVNDRGPFHDGRIIDLSYAAAKKLRIAGNGTARVEVAAINHATSSRSRSDLEITPIGTSNPPAIQHRPQTSHQPNTYYLQVGAYSDKANAEKALTRLIMDSTYPAHISAVTNTANKTLYRVRLGPYQNREHLQSIQLQLLESGFHKTHIVADQHDVP